MNTTLPEQAVALPQPLDNASLQEWVDWFFTAFLPGWIERSRDPSGFGFYDLLDENAQPTQQHRRTVLAQSRLLFTFSHLALVSKKIHFHDAARLARDALPLFRNAQGNYCCARSGNGQPSGDADDALALSYDQSFVILGLSTWGRLNPEDNVLPEIEECWSAIESNLTDPATGLLLEHDGLADPTHPSAPYRAQNPHMHLYEAALQVYEMTNRPAWLERASHMRSKGLEYFYDRNSCTIVEFIAPDLSPLKARDGQRREIGHQCEWAWLLHREAELGGAANDYSNILDIADSLLAFADTHGMVSNKIMQGAVFDAVSSDASWCEEKFLLWPQTEAIKTFAIRKEQAEQAACAQHLMLLVFHRYFAGHAAFINQLDANGNTIWPEALSRLLYHIVLALTEGIRAGLWEMPD